VWLFSPRGLRFTEDIHQFIGYQKRSSIPFSCSEAYRHMPITSSYIPLLIAALPITPSNNLTSTCQPPSGNRKSARPLLLGMNDASGIRMERGTQDILLWTFKNDFHFRGSVQDSEVRDLNSSCAPVSARPVTDISFFSGLQLLPVPKDNLHGRYCTCITARIRHLPSNGREGTRKGRKTDSRARVQT
jgi:hypothetical protein